MPCPAPRRAAARPCSMFRPHPLLLCRPVYGPDNALTDFAFAYLNPAAQRLLALPARPGGTLSTHWPAAQTAGTVAFCRRVFEVGEADHPTVADPADAPGPYRGADGPAQRAAAGG
ncbi:MAG: hypothetical protein WKG07_39785 [Hymenobacter sp.]